MANRDVYIARMKRQLDELNFSMRELEVQATDVKHDTLEKYKTEMSRLREQSHQAIDRLEQLKTAGEYAWKNLVADAERVRDASAHSLHNFKSKL